MLPELRQPHLPADTPQALQEYARQVARYLKEVRALASRKSLAYRN